MQSRAAGPLRTALLSAALLGVFALTLAPRLEQYRQWTDASETHFAEGLPVASADSYRWLREAEALRRGTPSSARDPLRRAPQGVAATPPLLLPRAMAWLDRTTGIGVGRAGMLLCAVLAGLFVFPAGLLFARLGQPLAGLWAGLVGGLAPAYLQRSAAYRIDTDGGNLFFAWAAAFGLAEVRAEASLRRNLGLAAASGLTLAAFVAWYDQPGFVLAYAAAFAATLWAKGFDGRRAAALLVVLLALASPWRLLEAASDLAAFARDYAAGAGAARIELAKGTLVLPDVLAEIDELRRAPLGENLASLTGSAPLAAIGLAGFAAFALRRWRDLGPLLPLLALGALGLLRSVRFAMYLAPFAGAGLGLLLSLGLERAARLLAPGLDPPRRTLAVGAVGLAAFAPLLPVTAFFEAPHPRVGVELLASLRALGRRAPPDAIVVHTWGRGYLINAASGRATLDDGEDPDPLLQQLLAVGLAAPDPTALHAMLDFLAARGAAGAREALVEAGSYRALIARVARREDHSAAPVLLLLTREQIAEFSHVFRKARWDFARGRGPRDGYDVRHCSGAGGALLRCEKLGRAALLVDPEQGAVDGRRIVRRVVRVRDGRVASEHDFADEGVTLQLVEWPGQDRLELHVLNEAVFASAFNQLFVLGRTPPELFEAVRDDWPVARVWRLVAAPPG